MARNLPWPARGFIGTLVFVVLSPLALLGAGFISNHPSSFGTPGEWLRYLAVVAIIGFAAGLIWFRAGDLPDGFPRYWLRSTVVLALFQASNTSLFTVSPVLWATTILVVSLVLGAVIGIGGRFLDSYLDRKDAA